MFKDVIGKSFKRCRYGLSAWKDTVVSVYMHDEYVSPGIWVSNVMIEGSKDVYLLSEVEFV